MSCCADAADAAAATPFHHSADVMLAAPADADITLLLRRACRHDTPRHVAVYGQDEPEAVKCRYKTAAAAAVMRYAAKDAPPRRQRCRARGYCHAMLPRGRCASATLMIQRH